MGCCAVVNLDSINLCCTLYLRIPFFYLTHSCLPFPLSHENGPHKKTLEHQRGKRNSHKTSRENCPVLSGVYSRTVKPTVGCRCQVRTETCRGPVKTFMILRMRQLTVGFLLFACKPTITQTQRGSGESDRSIVCVRPHK
ncbi:hypothetical protein AVEN_271429-1 [Araneus ventricosus]|uniref:Uncharacterized protein n=1 Tax=Araneus ventricosus TaxID=182803 RepID=A0A4Y2P9J3_ARAVE|nr:hypothetical protein AVEN_271429-1 [Araneus ventricosus]